MIVIFEPQCRGFAHEQFNAALLYGYLLAHPDDEIVFWGEEEHIRCIQDIFHSANLAFDRVDFVATEIPQSNTLSRTSVMVEYYKIFNRLLNYAFNRQCQRIVLLSIYTYNLIPLKLLIHSRFKDFFSFHIMMHGTLEFIKRKNFSIPFRSRLLKTINLVRKFLGLEIVEVRVTPTNNYIYERFFKKSLQLLGNKNILYYVFRDDSLTSVGKYLPNFNRYLRSIDLPYIFTGPQIENRRSPSNKIVFATVGRSDVIAVQRLVQEINNNRDLDLSKLEVRLIGSQKAIKDGTGLLKYVGNGRSLTRAQIEDHIKDVQYILFFFDFDTYELTTSGSFFDAVAYCKPMLFLGNACFDYYFRDYNFGYRCANVKDMVSVIKTLMSKNDEQYLEFCSEIRRMQNDVSIKHNYHKLRFE